MTTQVESEPLGRPDPPHADRFRFLYGALAAVGLAAIVAAALAFTGGTPEPERAWSSWQPSERGLKGAQEIADHVAPRYKQDDGDQLVFVTGGDVTLGNLEDLPVKVALRPDPASSTVRLLDGDTVQYTLNGLGPNGAIRSGKPSVERHLLLRREGLELALYTFKYLRGIDSVVVLMPPRPKAKASQALLFRKEQLEPMLKAPLRVTLPSPPPAKVKQVDDQPEATLVEKLTGSALYQFSITQGPDAGALLVLDPLQLEP